MIVELVKVGMVLDWTNLAYGLEGVLNPDIECGAMDGSFKPLSAGRVGLRKCFLC